MTLSWETKLERFNSRVEKTDTCWIWNGPTDKNGYGHCSGFINPFKTHWAHRIAWMIEHGEIPKGLEILHSCNRRVCVNPNHMRLGTRKQNMQQASLDGRLLHWKRPHGEGNVRSKLSNERVLEVVSLLLQGVSKTEVARRMGVSRITIYRVSKGRSWRHLENVRVPDLRIKITPQIVEDIRRLRGSKTQEELSRMFNLSRTSVGKIQRGI